MPHSPDVRHRLILATLSRKNRRVVNRALQLLLIEDEGNDALLFSLALEKMRLDVALQTVADGQAGIEYLRGDGIYSARLRYPLPDVVVLDLRLPKISGTEFLRWCRNSKDFSQLPIVVLTGSVADDQEIQRALTLGARRTFLKVSTVVELQAVIKEIHEFGLRCRAHSATAWNATPEIAYPNSRPVF